MDSESGEKREATSLARAVQEPTTPKEVWAWWLYMVAIEPVSVVVLQFFLPLLLSNLPAMVGHIVGKPGIPCGDHADKENCAIYEIGSLVVSGTTFTYIILAVAVALQAVVFICFGALADYGSRRRKFLAASTILGALSCMAAMGIRGSWADVIGGSLDVLITIAFGLSLMLYNAYLPLLAESHPDTTSFRSEDPIEVTRRREVVANNLSTKSFMVGYASAVLVLIMCAVYMFFSESGATELRHCIAFCGLFWLLGSIYPLANLKPRPGPSLPKGANYLTFSIRKTFNTISKRRSLPHIFWYLVAFFLFADGCNTIGQVAVIFAREELRAEYTTLITCAILIPFSGVLGNFFFFFLQKKFKMTSKATLLWILSGLAAVTIYGGSGVFFTAIGLHHVWELYVVSVMYGFLMGAMQSFSRVIYGEMIPPGEEAEFFSLYAITDKGSSWMGPVVQALVASLLKDQRWGLFFLGAMILLPFPIIIYLVDPVKGRSDAIAFSRSKSREQVTAPMSEK